jgi:hypothetical protein
MTIEQLVRDQLDRATRQVPGGPDLGVVVRRGRQQRRRRRGGLALAGVAGVGLGALGVHVATADDSRSVVNDAPVAEAPAPSGDFVPGTDIDENVAAVVAARLPALPAPDDIYPSDSHTAGPIPDADWASAEDWQATYTENGNQVLLITGLPSEGPNACEGCPSQQVPGGTVYTQPYSSTGQDGRTKWYFGVYFARDDGTFANAWEIVVADGQQAAEAQRHVSDADLAALVQDPGLTFAALGATAP